MTSLKAMVLCAGLGTRLRPLTTLWPKPAIPFLGAPLFRSALATLAGASVREVAINTHHLPEVMARAADAETRRFGMSLSMSHESQEIQGTGGGIRGLRAFFSGGDFVVLNGDVLFIVDLAPLVAAHRRSGAAATMGLLPMPHGATYNAVEIDEAHHVRRIAGKGPGGPRLMPWHFTGVHVMTPTVFDFMRASGAEDINHDVYPRMLEAGLVVGAHCFSLNEVYWSDLGTPERYAATHRDALFGQIPFDRLGDASPWHTAPKHAGNYWSHLSARLSDVRVSGPAFFGEACELGRGVHIGSAVSVGPGARLGDGVRLNRVVVFDGAQVEAGARLEDVLVAPGGIVIPVQG
jgi:mannose-1-phosphate guanylyltransferase